MAGDRQNDEVTGDGALLQTINVGEHTGAAHLRIDQRHHVLDPHLAECADDVTGVGRRSLELPDMLIGIDPDHQRTRGSLARSEQLQWRLRCRRYRKRKDRGRDCSRSHNDGES
jgi:hypothetical protein